LLSREDTRQTEEQPSAENCQLSCNPCQMEINCFALSPNPLLGELPTTSAQMSRRSCCWTTIPSEPGIGCMRRRASKAPACRSARFQRKAPMAEISRHPLPRSGPARCRAHPGRTWRHRNLESRPIRRRERRAKVQIAGVGGGLPCTYGMIDVHFRPRPPAAGYRCGRERAS
jgi:hypothetical protein